MSDYELSCNCRPCREARAKNSILQQFLIEIKIALPIKPNEVHTDEENPNTI